MMTTLADVAETRLEVLRRADAELAQRRVGGEPEIQNLSRAPSPHPSPRTRGEGAPPSLGHGG